MKKLLVICLVFLLISLSLASAATLKGTIYNADLEVETDVLVEIDTSPTQKYLSKDGTYSFELPLGEYTLKATKGFTYITEEVKVTKEGEYLFDLFLIPDFTDEDELWAESEETYFAEDEEGWFDWRYLLGIGLLIVLLIRFVMVRKKWGPLTKFRKKVRIEQHKTIEEHKREIAQDSSYLERVLEIIRKHDGRIYQKQLRKEMLDLSEAKISLIITELEHKGKIEKIKKGRGNVLILKNG